MKNWIKERLQLIAVCSFASTFIVLMVPWSGLALFYLLIGGAIEAYLIYKGRITITDWYVPILPRQVDMPIAIGVWIALTVRAIFIVQTAELDIYWVSTAFALIWIVAHLCSYEK